MYNQPQQQQQQQVVGGPAVYNAGSPQQQVLPNGQTVTIIEQNQAGPEYSNYNRHNEVYFLAGADLVLALAGIAVSAVILVNDGTDDRYDGWVPIVGMVSLIISIFGGLFFFCNVCIAFAGGYQKSSCPVITTLVFNIITLVIFTMAWIAFDAATIATDGFGESNSGVIKFVIVNLVFAILRFAVSLAMCILVCRALATKKDQEPYSSGAVAPTNQGYQATGKF